jgi:hypothetical protein
MLVFHGMSPASIRECTMIGGRLGRESTTLGVVPNSPVRGNQGLDRGGVRVCLHGMTQHRRRDNFQRRRRGRRMRCHSWGWRGGRIRTSEAGCRVSVADEISAAAGETA